MSRLPDMSELLLGAPRVREAYDTSTRQFNDYVALLRARLHSKKITIAQADAIFLEMESSQESVLTARTALKIIEGFHNAEYLSEHLTKRGEAATITVIQPMYRETFRISPRTKDNIHGENALTYKLQLFDSIQKKHPNLHFRLLAVDDGCDGWGEDRLRSGIVARGIIRQWRRSNSESKIEARTIFLAKGIADKSPLIPRGIKQTGDSVKGGSVIYGMNYANHEWRPDTHRHIIIDSDSDLSVHPAQIPTLVRKLIDHDLIVAAGSRRETNSVGAIGAVRDARGKLFISIWQRLLPTLASSVTDTNRGFKAIDAQFASELVQKIRERKFPYQIELLLVAELIRTGSVKPVAISYIDSEALSTQGEIPTQSYFDQIVGILAIAKRHHEPYDKDLERLIQVRSKLGKKAA